MPDDLPIYPDASLRTRLQFADLERLRGKDTSVLLQPADEHIAGMEGAANLAEARSVLNEPTKVRLIEAHQILFHGRPGAGKLRRIAVPPVFRGQDAAPPEFIDRSLNNFFGWLDAESLAQIHPIEKAALVLTRIVDIWPFEFGNLTMAVVFANAFLISAGYGPFYVRNEHLPEFNKALAQAMMLETQSLVNAMHQTIKREMESIDAR